MDLQTAYNRRLIYQHGIRHGLFKPLPPIPLAPIFQNPIDSLPHLFAQLASLVLSQPGPQWDPYAGIRVKLRWRIDSTIKGRVREAMERVWGSKWVWLDDGDGLPDLSISKPKISFLNDDEFMLPRFTKMKLRKVMLPPPATLELTPFIFTPLTEDKSAFFRNITKKRAKREHVTALKRAITSLDLSRLSPSPPPLQLPDIHCTQNYITPCDIDLEQPIFPRPSLIKLETARQSTLVHAIDKWRDFKLVHYENRDASGLMMKFLNSVERKISFKEQEAMSMEGVYGRVEDEEKDEWYLPDIPTSDDWESAEEQATFERGANTDFEGHEVQECVQMEAEKRTFMMRDHGMVHSSPRINEEISEGVEVIPVTKAPSDNSPSSFPLVTENSPPLFRPNSALSIHSSQTSNTVSSPNFPLPPTPRLSLGSVGSLSRIPSHCIKKNIFYPTAGGGYITQVVPIQCWETINHNVEEEVDELDDYFPEIEMSMNANETSMRVESEGIMQEAKGKEADELGDDHDQDEEFDELSSDIELDLVTLPTSKNSIVQYDTSLQETNKKGFDYSYVQKEAEEMDDWGFPPLPEKELENVLEASGITFSCEAIPEPPLGDLTGDTTWGNFKRPLLELENVLDQSAHRKDIASDVKISVLALNHLLPHERIVGLTKDRLDKFQGCDLDAVDWGLDAFLDLKGKVIRSRKAIGYTPTAQNEHMVESNTSPPPQPHHGLEIISVICPCDLFLDMKRIMTLKKWGFDLVERPNSEGLIYIIVDGTSCIIIQTLVDCRHVENPEQFIEQFSTFSLSFSTMLIIFESLDAQYRSDLWIDSQFKERLEVGVDLHINFSTSLDFTADLARDFMETRKEEGRLYRNIIWEERNWLGDVPTPDERNLLQIPYLNPLNAAFIASRFSLEAIIGMSPEERLQRFQTDVCVTRAVLEMNYRLAKNATMDRSTDMEYEAEVYCTLQPIGDVKEERTSNEDNFQYDFSIPNMQPYR